MSNDVGVRVPSCAQNALYNSPSFRGFSISTKHIQNPGYCGSAEALEGLDGLWFDALELSASHTNYDHEDLLESIEVFRTRGYGEVKKDIKNFINFCLL